MDPPVAKDILKFLKERVITREDPRELGKPLVGPFKSFWRYRKGSYRIIVDIQDDCLVIEVINVDHRRDIYSSF
jgi:mRNA interferase RelE/StbE